MHPWTLRDHALCRTFSFPTYRDTITFVNALADLAEAMNHHPEMRVGYNRVEVFWTTHDAAGITDLDHLAAQRTDAVYGALALTV